jgi:hypothetical protein
MCGKAGMSYAYDAIEHENAVGLFQMISTAQRAVRTSTFQTTTDGQTRQYTMSLEAEKDINK